MLETRARPAFLQFLTVSLAPQPSFATIQEDECCRPAEGGACRKPGGDVALQQPPIRGRDARHALPSQSGGWQRFYKVEGECCKQSMPSHLHDTPRTTTFPMFTGNHLLPNSSCLQVPAARPLSGEKEAPASQATSSLAANTPSLNETRFAAASPAWVESVRKTDNLKSRLESLEVRHRARKSVCHRNISPHSHLSPAYTKHIPIMSHTHTKHCVFPVLHLCRRHSSPWSGVQCCS